MSIPIVKKYTPKDQGPGWMPKAVKGRDGIINLFPTPLDPKRCWLMQRPRIGHPGEVEMILTPASKSTDPTEEDFLTDFLDRFGWKIALSMTDRRTSTGRFEHYWFDAPNNLKDPEEVLATIQQELKQYPDGPNFLKDFEKRFRNGKLHLITSLDPK